MGRVGGGLSCLVLGVMGTYFVLPPTWPTEYCARGVLWLWLWLDCVIVGVGWIGLVVVMLRLLDATYSWKLEMGVRRGGVMYGVGGNERGW